ncbi:uncharacterized protein SPAPADRAFT_54194 [Spathaspora passalidarum NRRL Y-27907]|uniref:Mss4-like protein n=1 Tax=Spathaspora passalidarum (strain NRRL Y-27907 / 11-Y1) TaxID=619300 RepID=G3AJP1_SPAPN|nr:uncharacterized protein SPAPADRAFT_54194 [Spathaspora passalidarum NRRL Y-27907]EGW33942.1 hypothetical protein SPAPADRAFT_54194 [Spathaspora passalidarum NRRL Y-27907]
MPLELSSEIDLEKLQSEDHNVILRCPFKQCNTRIIKYSPSFIQISVDNAPQTVKATKDELPTIERPTNFYQIDNVWDFDNIGVSRPSSISDDPIIGHDSTVKIDRLLICSECDKGPLGFAGIPTDKEHHHTNLKYFLSCNSTMYEV